MFEKNFMDIDSKAKAMAKTSTNKMTEEALAAYNELALKKGDYDGIIFRYDGKNIQLQTKNQSKSKNIWDLLENNEPRFVVQENNGKLILVYWKPSEVKAMEAMKYNSVKGGLEKELGNLKTVEINDKTALMALFK